ncbi:MAG: amino acid racemase [Nitrososphaerota archaeon]|nr:amino acid racemase [Candidatus Bathyarchaeota archaeon]MDW8022184.1 amino acid racemase [Nitrososphaerota archaeon]
MGRPKHIGIVGVSAPGAALCYQAVCTEGEKILGERYAHPEVSMHAFSFSSYMTRIEHGDWDGVAKLMVASAKKLASIGADFVICPDNTVHIAFGKVAEKSPVPWLHIAQEVAKEAERLGFRKLAVLGTRFLMESDVYPSKLRLYGIKWAVPETGQREIVNKIIFSELVYGIVKPESREKLASIISDMAQREGCDAVVLGCTELPLILDGEHSPIPTLDSTRILARAALKKATEQT